MFGLSADVLIGRILVIFLGIPIHEWALGGLRICWAMRRRNCRGDSLNPFVHLDPIGTLSILLTGLGGGVPRENPLPDDAGVEPADNACQHWLVGIEHHPGLILALPFRLGLLAMLEASMAYRLAQVLSAAIAVNIGLAAFNLLPIPPLDGSRVLAGLAPRRVGDFIEASPMPCILLFVLFLLPRLGLDLKISLMVNPLQQFFYRICCSRGRESALHGEKRAWHRARYRVRQFFSVAGAAFTPVDEPYVIAKLAGQADPGTLLRCSAR